MVWACGPSYLASALEAWSKDWEWRQRSGLKAPVLHSMGGSPGRGEMDTRRTFDPLEFVTGFVGPRIRGASWLNITTMLCLRPLHYCPHELARGMLALHPHLFYCLLYEGDGGRQHGSIVRSTRCTSIWPGEQRPLGGPSLSANAQSTLHSMPLSRNSEADSHWYKYGLVVAIESPGLRIEDDLSNDHRRIHSRLSLQPHLALRSYERRLWSFPRNTTTSNPIHSWLGSSRFVVPPGLG